MRRLGIVGLCLTVLLAVGAGAVASASASGTPEWYECLKVKGGGYEKGCSKEGGKGGFVLAPLLGSKSFEAKGKKVSFAVVVPGKGTNEITCNTVKENGELVAPNLLRNVVLRFASCEKCFNEEEANPKYIFSETLSGELGYISHSPLKVGIKLSNQADPGGPVQRKIRCGTGDAQRWNGTLSGELLGDVDVASKKSSFSYTAGPYLGEVEPGYTPLMNEPFEGEEAGQFRAEVKEGIAGGGFLPEGGRPGALEGTIAIKGETYVKA
jgi:hypothetical protein